MSKYIEEWKPIEDFEGFYEVSDWGRVKSLDRIISYYSTRYKHLVNVRFKGKILVQSFDKDGYKIVGLHKNGELYNKRVHILVAETFIPNPENKPVVGHLKTMENGLEDRTANEAWNIKWMTFEENANYGTLLQRKSEMMKSEYECGKRKKVWLGKKRPEHSRALSIPIVEIKKDGTIIEWKSASDYTERNGGSYPHLVNAVNGKNRKIGHHYKGSQFYKKEEYEKMIGEAIAPPTII